MEIQSWGLRVGRTQALSSLELRRDKTHTPSHRRTTSHIFSIAFWMMAHLLVVITNFTLTYNHHPPSLSPTTSPNTTTTNSSSSISLIGSHTTYQSPVTSSTFTHDPLILPTPIPTTWSTSLSSPAAALCPTFR
ncbi:hypothetical protein Pcinc_015453 [Petrolisthes cinctipes]|uniref:Uncharacterized protein n=1 Tax=Petrolisthes cinctipes TaxID=88211 RepID=A0AAE1KQG0_PETCI|nr:hypothetical protein Pcinc_015453 [Petrolisthes cinctipes]